MINKTYLRENLLTGEPWEALQVLLLDLKAKALVDLVKHPSPPTSLQLAGRIEVLDEIMGIKRAYQLMDILEAQEKEALAEAEIEQPPIDDGM